MTTAIARWMLPALLVLTGCSAELAIDDPWVRAAPPGAGMTAGYLTLTNGSSHPATLIGASCDSYDEVSLHETRVENGTSKMRAMGSLVVAPDSTVVFAPGGRHLMLMGPTRRLVAGDSVQITLHFSERDDLSVEATVRLDE